MIARPTRSSRTDKIFPYLMRFRSADHREIGEGRRAGESAGDVAVGHRDVPRHILARELLGQPAFEREVVGLRRGERLGGEIGAAEGVEADELLQRDRKSVVSGKRVSVRVDLGGRRIIKQKNTTNTN